ncbi:MAG: YbaB/EbfC family nucleoid-associated protein [Campylobacterota bacterium]|nr:YbaB/EbfC family nucleoid-associated protein [Campylobacterota bacterium]
MFEGLNLGDMGKMLEEVQEKAKEVQEQSKNIQFTAKAGGGLISLTANGLGEVIDLEIDDSLMDDKESLQILLISVMNDITRMVEENKKSQAMGMMGGVNPFGS